MGCCCPNEPEEEDEAIVQEASPKPSAPLMISVSVYVIRAAVEGIVTMRPDDLSQRFGRDLPAYDIVRWDGTHETYVFVVDNRVNVELLCGDFGFECNRMMEGMLNASEYCGSYRVNSTTLCAARNRVDHRDSHRSASSSSVASTIWARSR